MEKFLFLFFLYTDVCNDRGRFFISYLFFMKKTFVRFKKVVSSTLLATLLFSFIGPLDKNTVFAGNPGPSFTDNETQAAGTGTSAVAAQIIDAITIT